MYYQSEIRREGGIKIKSQCNLGGIKKKSQCNLGGTRVTLLCEVCDLDACPCPDF